MKDANEVVNVSRYDETLGQERATEQCYACGHKVYVEWDEDGTPRVYRAIEYDEALELARELG